MSEEKKVYVISKGEYEYLVFRVYSTKEKADAFMNGCENVMGDYSCDEHTLDEFEDDELVRLYRVELYFDTGTFRAGHFPPEGDRPRIKEIAELRKKGDRSFKVERGPIMRLHMPVFGVAVSSPVSAEHAIEVAVADRRKWFREQWPDAREYPE